MSKYLLSVVDRDDEAIPASNIYVLPINKSVVASFAKYMRIAEFVVERRMSLKAMEFAFPHGYWMTIDDPEWIANVFGKDRCVVRELEDIMAIVGDDVMDERLVVEPDGDISFRGIHSDSNLYLRARPIKITELEKALNGTQ